MGVCAWASPTLPMFRRDRGMAGMALPLSGTLDFLLGIHTSSMISRPSQKAQSLLALAGHPWFLGIHISRMIPISAQWAILLTACWLLQAILNQDLGRLCAHRDHPGHLPLGRE